MSHQNMQEYEQIVTFERKVKKLTNAIEKKEEIVYYIRWETMGFV